MDEEILPHAWADVDYNNKGIYLATRSGYRRTAFDDNGARHFLPRNASSRMVGEALLNCLNLSRVVPQEEWKAFFDWRDAERRAKDYEKWRFSKSGLKTRAAFSKYLMMCRAEVFGPTIFIHSYGRGGPRSWCLPSDYMERAVRIPFDSPPSQIGAALREAMNRCTGLGRDEAQLPEPMPD